MNIVIYVITFDASKVEMAENQYVQYVKEKIKKKKFVQYAIIKKE